MNIDVAESEHNVTMMVKHEGYLSVAEISAMSRDNVHDYLELAQVSDKDMTDIQESLARSDKAFFFNRINVPAHQRNQGIGKALLEKLLEHCKKSNNFLLLTVNNYGEMGQENLIEFYQKAGFKLLYSEGLMVYSKDLDTKLEKKSALKM